MLIAKNISHSFEYQLFKDIEIESKPKDKISIVGRSGSGKSTLLHILSSFLEPNSGEVIFDGKSIYQLPQRELIALRRYKFGIIFQSHYLFRGFSGVENLEVASILSNQSIDRELLKELKIERVISQRVSTLSGGEQQRVSIARVLTKKPKVIFADEPTGNLDQETSKDVMEVIFNYIERERATLFLVTHDEDLAKSTDRVYRVDSKDFKLDV